LLDPWSSCRRWSIPCSLLLYSLWRSTLTILTSEPGQHRHWIEQHLELPALLPPGSRRRSRSPSPLPPHRPPLHPQHHSKVRMPLLHSQVSPAAHEPVGRVPCFRRPPPVMEALVRQPSHLPVALVGFAILPTPRRTWPRPNPWPLARD
jgi:hypothetical protein